MILKRVVNILVTIPILICFFVLFAFMFYLVNHSMLDLDASEVVGPIKFFKVSVGVIFATLLIIGMLRCFALLIVLILTGDGIIWRKVEKNNFLLSKEGEVVHVFKEPELIWRYHKMFSSNKLRQYEVSR